MVTFAGLLPRAFVGVDKRFRGYRRDHFGYDVERTSIKSPESHTGLPHVEFFTRFPKALLERRQLFRVLVGAHEIERVALRGRRIVARGGGKLAGIP